MGIKNGKNRSKSWVIVYAFLVKIWPKINLVQKFAFLIRGQIWPKICQNHGLQSMRFGQSWPEINLVQKLAYLIGGQKLP